MLPCGIEARANATENGQGSSVAVANAGKADGEKRKSGGPEATGNLPADKELDQGAEKPVENNSGKQTDNKTANEIEQGFEPAVPEQEEMKKRAGDLGATTSIVID